MLQQFTPRELRALAALREQYEAEGPEDERAAARPSAVRDERVARIILRCLTAVLALTLLLVSAFIVWCVVALAQLQR